MHRRSPSVTRCWSGKSSATWSCGHSTQVRALIVLLVSRVFVGPCAVCQALVDRHPSLRTAFVANPAAATAQRREQARDEKEAQPHKGLLSMPATSAAACAFNQAIYEADEVGVDFQAIAMSVSGDED